MSVSSEFTSMMFAFWIEKKDQIYCIHSAYWHRQNVYAYELVEGLLQASRSVIITMELFTMHMQCLPASL